MPEWYEVFDNEEVQFLTRKRVAKLTIGFAAGVVVTLAVFFAALASRVPPQVGVPVVVLAWTFPAAWLIHRLSQLRRVVWCVKVSSLRVVGYDYARRKTDLDWTGAEQLNLTKRSLILVGPGGRSLEVPHLFPDFPALSHRLVDYAEQHRVPIYVDGQPWEALDVYSLYPFIPGDHAARA